MRFVKKSYGRESIRMQDHQQFQRFQNGCNSNGLSYLLFIRTLFSYILPSHSQDAFTRTSQMLTSAQDFLLTNVAKAQNAQNITYLSRITGNIKDLDPMNGKVLVTWTTLHWRSSIVT